jgi:hypothetical protein
MKFMHYYLSVMVVVVFINVTYAQKPPMKFGNIDDSNFQSEICPIDSNAHAYYIFDYGESYFDLENTRIRENDPSSKAKFQMIFKRHFRIKIIDNQGFDLANIEIPLYHKIDEERIISLKASTYNLEGKKIIKSKFNFKDLITEETSDNWITKKLALPNVMEGSIIEVEYIIKSDFFFNLRSWYFQRSIPVLQSEYHVKIPQYFVYNQTQYGYSPIKRETGRKARTITLTYVSTPEPGLNKGSNSGTYSSNINFQENEYDYYAYNINAFPFEDYLKTAQNYLTKIEFELDYTEFPGQARDFYNTSWDQVNTELLESYSFGKELTRTSHIKKDVEELRNSGIEGTDLMNSAFNLIKKKLAWNGEKNKYVTNSLGRAYNENGGNCADINLNLVILLRGLGFDANPLVLSTADNGIIHPSHPSLSSFNYVIAHVRLDDNNYLMDATDPLSEINLLPVRCLNDKGKIVSQTKSDWVNLMDYKPYIFKSNYELSFDENFKLEGERTLNLEDYAAYSYSGKIKKFNDLDDFARDIEKTDPNLSIEDIELERDSVSNHLKLRYHVTLNSSINSGSGIIYFSPFIQSYYNENPFKLEKREFPVEFSYQRFIQQDFIINLPEGYEVSEIPEPISSSLPNELASYRCQIIKDGNKISVSTALVINKSLYLPENYDDLKQLFQTMIDKQKEVIVIKKV